MAFYKSKVGWLLFAMLVLIFLYLIVFGSRGEILNIFEKDNVEPEMVVEKNAFGMPVGFVSMKGNIIGDVREDENGVFYFNFESSNLYDVNGIYRIIVSWGLNDVAFSVGGETGNSVGFNDFESLISESKDKIVTLDVFLMNDELWKMTVESLSEHGVGEVILEKYQDDIFCTVDKINRKGERTEDCNTLLFYNLSV